MTTIDDDVRRQILLEIALSISGELELRALLGKSLPLFLRKLNCTAAAVVQLADPEPITSQAVPLSIPRHPEWPKMVRRIRRNLNEDPEQFFTEAQGPGGLWFGFRLRGFGMLLLARPAVFDPLFLREFQPLTDMLARACLACLESERRKQVEQKLALTQASQRALLDNLPFMAWMKDAKGRYTAVNKSFADHTGLQFGDIIGKTTHEVWPQEKAALFAADDESILRTGQPVEGRDQETSPNGDIHWFEYAKHPIIQPASGEITGTTGFRWDVSSRVLAEQNLKYRTAFQRVVMDLAIGFVNTPLERLDQGINNALAMTGQFAGVDRAYLFRYDFVRNVMDNTHEWCAAGIAPQITNLRNISNTQFPDWVQAHRQGEIVHIPSVADLALENPIRAVLDSQGIRTLITLPLIQDQNCFGFVGFDVVQEEKVWSDEEIDLLRILAELFTNAEVRRAHERHLVEARAGAEAASRAKSEFLANMSHEIRTPLHGVVSMIGLLKETRTSQEQQEFLHMAETSAESLLSVINDILDFSKIEAGKLELSLQFFDLEDEIHRMSGLIAAKAREKNLELMVRYDPKTPRIVEGDNLRLRQILSNLLANAIKFTERGHILLNVEPLYLEDGLAMIRFLVEDTGIGIPENRLQHIFEQFTQVDGSTSRRYGGTGLGLAICQQLVTMMGGTITVGSTVNRGSRFFFDLPLPYRKITPDKPTDTLPDAPPDTPSDASPDASLGTPHALPGNLRGYRALIVDDQAINRRILAEHLSAWGMDHESAESAWEAVRKLEAAWERSAPVDIMLLDYAMPEMNGVELAQTLRKSPKWRDLRLILLTSKWTQMNLRQCNELGLNAVLQKPVVSGDLFDTVRRTLSHVHGPGCTEEPPTNTDPDVPPPSLELSEFWGSLERPIHVLLVDDHPINRKSAVMHLRKLQCEVTTAENGLEALKLVQELDVDIVLMDVQMPVMDGYEATQAIRSLGGRYTTLPIIALTANAMEGDRQRCLDAGMTDYLPKPLPKDGLATLLAAHRPERTPQAENQHQSPPSGPDLDYAALLRQYEGDLDMAREMLQDFLADTPNEIASIGQALTRRDPITEQLAHRLKGPSSYVGAIRLQAHCSRIVETVRRGQWDATDQEFQALQLAWTGFTKESTAWLSKVKTDALD
ncbi:response regulator [Desulfonatronum thioautotrophicum]|uniref:response regulator n=1 Tax=Desulfonatronum thioautotrophicum TaxID=617001 RepID=UPI00069AB748|nr:response regulator [Desulfonatronum thioautotrophicum]